MKLLFLLLLFSTNILAKVSHELIPFAGTEKVEVYWTTPEGTGPFPVYLFVYSFQGNFKGGAAPFAKSRMLSVIANGGFVGVVSSQAGQGESTGSPDHAGKISQEGLKAVIRHLKTLPRVDSKKIYLHGVSMGASLAALVAADVPDLGGLILENGAYDIDMMMMRLIHQSFGDQRAKKMYDILDAHTGNGPDRYHSRSVIAVADRIKCPVLILTGAGDTLGLTSEAIRLHEAIPDSQLRIYPFSDHGIDRSYKSPDVEKFLEKLNRR